MNSDLLLIVDMQKVYMPGELWACPGIMAAESRLKTLLSYGKCDAVFTRFIANPRAEYVWSRYNVENSEINESEELNSLLPGFLPYIKDKRAELYDKSTYSCLSNTELRDRILELNKRGGSLLLSGVVAECCVLSTFFDAVDMGCHVIYLRDAVAGISNESEKAVERIIEGLSPLHAELMTVEEYMFGLSKDFLK